jgi:hypothetical protein
MSATVNNTGIVGSFTWSIKKIPGGYSIKIANKDGLVVRYSDAISRERAISKAKQLAGAQQSKDVTDK